MLQDVDRRLCSAGHCVVFCALQSSNERGFIARILPGKAGSGNSSGAFYKTRPVPATEIVAPFSLDASTAASANPIEFLSESQMREMDRHLAASAEPSIREGATMEGIEFDTGKWSYEQLVCQALPGSCFSAFP